MWHVYIIDRDGLLYTGMASDVPRRIIEHQSKCSAVKLLYTEQFLNKFQAAKREKQIKGWTRRKKIALIEGKLDLLKKL